jgi:hypothetical protein
MSITQFIAINQLQVTDAILLRKKFFGMVDHYVLFMGWRDQRPVFVANYKHGVQEVSQAELSKYLEKLVPEQIEYFPGDERARMQAWKRAWSRVGERAYDYISNNCEHFKNWVHHGEHRSEQVKVAGTVAQITGGALLVGALASRNPWLGLAGILAIAVGTGVKNAAED